MYIAGCYIKGAILKMINKYRIKHRFDKPPTAKSYCRDCKNFGWKSYVCKSTDKFMGKEGFCSHAEPLNAEELKQRDAEEKEYIKRLEKIADNIRKQVDRKGALHGTDL